MLRNKIYDGLKSYLDRYLFGFDKNQLNMSILKGNINLRQVNIRPDEANKLIDGLMLPITLKAGMIGNLQIKFSILSIWNNPVELTIDDLFLILGPNLSFVSHEESYIQDEELEASYDSTNVFNIFEHELQIKKKIKNIDKPAGQQLNKQEDNDEDSLRNNLNSFMKNLKLKVNRLHIRFEDDYFSGITPFSLGIVADTVELNTSDTEWTFDSFLHLNFFRAPPSNINDMARVVLKELNLKNARVYLNSLSEMYIPTSLWDQTRHLENQIFDAMPVNVLNDLMVQAFDAKEHQVYLVSEFSLFGNIYSYKPIQNNLKSQSILKVKLLFTQFDINITPPMIDDLSRLYEFMQNFSISLDLKQYRPQRRPIVARDDENTDLNQEEYIKRKRRLLVRDWFFYVVWYVRLRKLLVNFYSEQVIEQEIENNPEKYKDLMKAAENGRDSIRNFIENQSKLQNKDNKGASTEDQQKRYLESVMLMKFQNINLNIYESYEKYKVKNQKLPEPSIQIALDTFVYENNAKHNSNILNKQIMIKDVKLFNTQFRSKDQQMVQKGQSQNIHANIPKSGFIKDNNSHTNIALDSKKTLSGNLTNFQQSKGKQAYDPYQQQPINSHRSINNNQLLNNNANNRPAGSFQQAYTSTDGYNNIRGNNNLVVSESTDKPQDNSLLNMFGIKNAVSSFFGGLTQSSNLVSPRQQQQNQGNNNATPNQFESGYSQNRAPVQSASYNTSAYKDDRNSQYSQGNNYTYQNAPINNEVRRGGFNGINDHQDEIEAILGMGSRVPNNRKGSNQIGIDNNPIAFINRGRQQNPILGKNNSYNRTQLGNRQQQASRLGTQQSTHQLQSRNNISDNPSQQQINTQQKQNRPAWSEQVLDTHPNCILPSIKGEPKGQFIISKNQFCHIKCQDNDTSSAAFTMVKQSNITTPTNGINRKLDYSVTLGFMDIEYTNDILKNMCDTMLEYKQLHVFRYVPLKNLFQGRQNIHRKIELHAPLYLIKKLFITDPQNRHSIIAKAPQPEPSNNQNPFSDQNASKKNHRPINSEEDENISDDDDNDLRFKRKNIQAAVSMRDNTKMSHKFSSTKENAKFKQLLKDQKQQHDALEGMSSEEDTLLLKSIIGYEQQWNLYDLLANINLSSINIFIIPSSKGESASLNSKNAFLGGSLCKLTLQQQEIQLYKQKDESGFNAFGIQFQSTNRFQMYFYFIKSMKNAVDAYIMSPVFHQSSHEYFDKFRKLLKQNMQMKKYDDRETIKNIMGVHNTGDINQVFSKANEGESSGTNAVGTGLQLFNKEGFELQQKILKKGKTGVKGGTQQAHYNYIFNNLEDNNSSSQCTSKNEIINMGSNGIVQNNKSKKNKRSANKNDMEPYKIRSLDDDMSVHVVMSSDADEEDEEQKTPLALFEGASTKNHAAEGNITYKAAPFGKIGLAGGSVVENNKNKNSLSQVTSPTGLLANQGKKQNFGGAAVNPQKLAVGGTTKNFKVATANQKAMIQQNIVNAQDFSSGMQNIQALLQRGKSQEQTNNSTKNINTQSNKGQQRNMINIKQDLSDQFSSDDDTLIQERNQEELMVMASSSHFVQPTALAKAKSNNYDNKPYQSMVRSHQPLKK